VPPTLSALFCGRGEDPIDVVGAPYIKDEKRQTQRRSCAAALIQLALRCAPEARGTTRMLPLITVINACRSTIQSPDPPAAAIT
jgi:hypothetical protein